MSRASDERFPLDKIPKAMMGRADLLRALLVSDGAAGTVADSLGLVRKAPPVAKPNLTNAFVAEGVLPVATVSAHFSNVEERMPFWRLAQVTDFEPLHTRSSVSGVAPVPDDRPKPTTEQDIQNYRLLKRPRPRPIVPWSRLWPALSPLLRGREGLGPLDIEMLTARWSRLEWLSHLPRRAALGGSLLRVYVDRARRLVPFWNDQRWVLAHLDRYLGQKSVVVHWCVHGLDEPGQWLEGQGQVPPIGRGDRVLALTDLGLYGTSREQVAWQQLAGELRKKGATLTALVPVPKARWNRHCCGIWNAVDWSEPGRGRNGEIEPPSVQTLHDRADYLLGLLCATLRIEPEMLRELRRRLPRSVADIGTEADVWSHAKLLGKSSQGAWMEPAAAKNRREQFAKLPKEHRKYVVEAIKRWHEGREYGLFEAEVLFLSGDCKELDHLSETEIKAAKDLVRSIVAAMPGWGSTGALDMDVKRFVEQLVSRVGSGLREDPKFGPELAYARYKSLLPPPTETGPRSWQIRQHGADLILSPEGTGPGSPVATFMAQTPEVRIDDRAGKIPVPRLRYPDSAASPLPKASRIDVIGDSVCLTLERVEKPGWAKAMGRDPYGLWADWHVNHVVQRMRWIPPGKFIMGSPESEAGRWGDEGPAHEVRLTQGFWLADTPCTQALWETVMGDNPSNFVSKERPVEQVSYEDVDKFIAKLNESEDPPLRLPTEAEWEYACRAGTETSTYAGELEILGERNGPILDDIAWYGGNSGVGFELENGYDTSDWKERQYADSPSGTHPVKQKRPNGWGLYDTLGNVLEWCGDYWAEQYDPAQNKDPFGPRKGDDRVIRGGSWDDFARFVRAAVRLWHTPVYRDSNLGFRLSRGPAPSPARDGRSPESLSTAPGQSWRSPGDPVPERLPGVGRPSEETIWEKTVFEDGVQNEGDREDTPDKKGILSTVKNFFTKKDTGKK